MSSRTALPAVCGVVATALGTAAAHLVAALTDPAASPVLAVGSQVIDATPTPVKEWAVGTFGSAASRAGGPGGFGGGGAVDRLGATPQPTRLEAALGLGQFKHGLRRPRFRDDLAGAV